MTPNVCVFCVSIGSEVHSIVTLSSCAYASEKATLAIVATRKRSTHKNGIGKTKVTMFGSAGTIQSTQSSIVKHALLFLFVKKS